MLSPDQITQIGQSVEHICQKESERLATQLTDLLEFLNQPDLSAQIRDEAIAEAQKIISESGSRLRKRTNVAIISEFRRSASQSLNSDLDGIPPKAVEEVGSDQN